MQIFLPQLLLPVAAPFCHPWSSLARCLDGVLGLFCFVSAEWSGFRVTHYSGKEHQLNSSHAMQNVGWTTVLAVCPDALAWSHIDSCLTTGQHGRRRCSRRLMPEPAQRHQTTKSGSLLIGRDQGQKLRRGPRGPTRLCSTSLMLSITLSAAVFWILISHWLIQIHSCRH